MPNDAAAARLVERPLLLRAPPFPWTDAAVSTFASAPVDLPTLDRIETLFAAIRDARVGGNFWKPPFQGRQPASIDRRGIRSDVDPWSLLDGRAPLVAHGDDEWVALAVIAGNPVEVVSDGDFGRIGQDGAALRDRVARLLLSARYLDPFTGGDSVIDAAIAQLADWRRIFEGNRDLVAACGFAWWKRREIARFLWAPGHPPRFFWSERSAIRHASRQGGSVAVWPSRVSPQMPETARAQGTQIVRVEDGFVRSVGLGANLVPPSSISVDRRGIHYDPDRPSDLEHLLANATFTPELLARAAALRKTMLEHGISKYAAGGEDSFPERERGRRLVLVTGQVEDDMSVLYGGGGVGGNLELLRRVRAIEPDAEIWFRPHPDVDAGHRRGAVSDEDALVHADRVVRGGSMAGLLARIDAIHVLTSLAGFEALLRDRPVTCHGTPFYAGWGLTRDLAPVPGRRGRVLARDELVAAVLILYPRYLDPVTQLPCPPEVLVQRMKEGLALNRLQWLLPLRRLQGWMTRRRTGA